MIKSDYTLSEGKLPQEWEAVHVQDYINAVDETKDLLILVTAYFQAAVKIIEDNGIQTRLCSDDAFRVMTEAMERVVELTSLADYLSSRKEELAIEVSKMD